MSGTTLPLSFSILYGSPNGASVYGTSASMIHRKKTILIRSYTVLFRSFLLFVPFCLKIMCIMLGIYPVYIRLHPIGPVGDFACNTSAEYATAMYIEQTCSE